MLEILNNLLAAAKTHLASDYHTRAAFYFETLRSECQFATEHLGLDLPDHFSEELDAHKSYLDLEKGLDSLIYFDAEECYSIEPHKGQFCTCPNPRFK